MNWNDDDNAGELYIDSDIIAVAKCYGRLIISEFI